MSSRSADTIPRELTVEDTLAGHAFTWRTTWGLFSPRGVDDGTRLLTRHLRAPVEGTCMDLGCGWGPVGLVLSRLAPAGRVHMVDKDFVAVEYARRNAAQNGCGNCEVYLSNGFSEVAPEARFDVVASNLPAKVGNELFTIMFDEARQRLRPGGRLYVVSVNGLKDYLRRTFRELFGNYTKVKQGRAHVVSMAAVE